MSSYKEWLDAMPVEEIDRRVSELEVELATLRSLQKLRPHRQSTESRVKPPATRATAAPKRGRGGRVTPERQRILDVLRESPGGASVQQVAARLRDRGEQTSETGVAANMARMTKYGMLERVEQGRYQLPDEKPTTVSLLNGHGGDEGAYEP